MRKTTLLIIPLILVSAGCAHFGNKQIGAPSKGPTAVVTKSCIDGGFICREHNPETGLVVNSTFFDQEKYKYVPGIEADDVLICYGKILDKSELKILDKSELKILDKILLDKSDPERSDDQECRQRVYSSELFGKTNPTYSCGNWPCHFWP